MGLEVFTGIWTLNSTNPVGASDPKSQGDDHLRGIKAAILATFANVTGPVTASHAELNLLAGKSGTVWTSLNDGIGSGLDADLLDGQSSAFFQDAANLAAGVLPNARVQQSNVTQHQAALAIATSQVTSGTFADARIAASNVTQHQAALAISFTQLAGAASNPQIVAGNVTQHQGALALAATQLTSGVLADARVQQSNVTQHQAALALAASQLTSGTLGLARGGTNQTTQAGITRAVTLAWTIQSDPGGTPSGTAGDVFAYY